MRTQLSEFCQDFDRHVRPILTPLGTLIDILGQADPKLRVALLRGELNELRHQFQSLVEKVENQQAYVLIFGPLKSGKSTLMNAIAAAYVSEVSSLPAYPCLVYVSHGSNKEFLLTDYDGNTENYTDSEALKRRIEAAHTHLADTMRSVEEAGEVFDPQKHYRSAIRRVDVKVPAKDLAESGAVLVDTPGLYTRMRFGYDQMTQEFRTAAACAIFVVKSDTLYLEQVFSEFQQLLELFSRIFLVVNMDTRKRDVGPDGKLVPSLEQQSPEKIIQAFEALAMTATIKKAVAAGRVRIYPIDLLSAASIALQKTGTTPKDYQAFRDDLEAYLGSVEYLKAFLADSLRRSQGLSGETRRLIHGQEVAELKAEAESLEARRAECDLELGRLSACLQHDWSKPLARFTKDIDAELKRRSSDLEGKLSRAMSAAIDTWFLSGHSLKWLIDKQWQPLIMDYRSEVQLVALRRFEESCVQRDAGVDLDPEVASLLRFFNIGIHELRRAAQASQGQVVWQATSELLVAPGTIPIRRGILNILTLRSVDTVRQRLFGPDAKPDKKIPPKIKAARLGNPAKHHIRKALTQLQKTLISKTLTATRHRFCMALEDATAAEVARRLRILEPDLRAELAQIKRDAAAMKDLIVPIDELRSVIGQSLAGVTKLSERYAQTDTELLLQPLASEPEIVLPAAPRNKAKSRRAGPGRSKRRSQR